MAGVGAGQPQVCVQVATAAAVRMVQVRALVATGCPWCLFREGGCRGLSVSTNLWSLTDPSILI